jgi:putative Holliday junction resolvase
MAKSSAMSTATARPVILAFDFGERRIGVATANPRTRSASPLCTVAVGRTLPWPELDRIVADWRPGQIVVGLPQSSSSPTLLARIGEFARELGQRYAVPVATVDEHLSSRSARADLAEQRRSGVLRHRARREHIDALAACLIAEQWLATTPETPH